MSTRMDLLLTRAGISYRQLDYWCRRGFINDRMRRGNGALAEHRSIGYVRDIPADEEPVLLLMGRLVKTGIKLETAAFVARNAQEHDGALHCPLGEGIDLVIGKWVIS